MTKIESKSITFLLTLAGFIAIVFLTVIVGGIIVYNKANSEIKNLGAKNVVLQNDLFLRDSIVSELVDSFDSIENNLTIIKKKRNQLMFEDREIKPNQRDLIIRDIRMMDKMLVENSNKVIELEKKLHDSGIQLKAFQSKIASLNKTIYQQNSQIAELKLYIEDQNTELAIVNQQNDILETKVLAFRDTIYLKNEIIGQKEQIIKEQINIINKGYFASGTYKELVENGVVSKGGFFGLGKNRIARGNLNENYFTQVDITENRTFPLHAKKIHLISEHPSNSYKLIEEDGLITKLEIEFPEDFWKISNYAVIEVK